ncbi:MAG: DUF547 domain-containing protein [Acidobacteria bacterium]|nr:DUF547 domain-containing protein [Acidobacteriota bacterium]
MRTFDFAASAIFLALTCFACGSPQAAPLAEETSAPRSATVETPHTAEGVDLAPWERVLEKAAVDGGVDYAALAKSSADLDAFVASLATAEPAVLEHDGQVAFWINAYNALVIRSVLDRYPDVESVLKIEGFFDKELHRVAGEDLTLNQVEGKARALGDPRVHFALVCASIGCPDLSGEAYRREALEEQLARQTRDYLANPDKGLRYEAGETVLYLSMIFDWYAEDFGGDAFAWIVPHLPQSLAAEIRAKGPELRFLDYDWGLNDRSRERRAEAGR